MEPGLAYVMDRYFHEPLSTYQISVDFLVLCVVSQNVLNIKMQLESGETETKFDMISSATAVYAKEEVKKNLEWKKAYFPWEHLATLFVDFGDKVYETLFYVGFQYGTIFK